MKKTNIVVRFIALIAIAGAFAACATTRTPETTGEFIDDSVITTRVKSTLAADNFFKSFQIGVETHQGIVQLSGFVNSREVVDKAGKLAEGVKGVKSIKNDLLVK